MDWKRRHTNRNLDFCNHYKECPCWCSHYWLEIFSHQIMSSQITHGISPKIIDFCIVYHRFLLNLVDIIIIALLFWIFKQDLCNSLYFHLNILSQCQVLWMEYWFILNTLHILWESKQDFMYWFYNLGK